MPHNQQTAAERAQQIEASKGGKYAADQWDPVETPLKNKPALQTGANEAKPSDK